MNKISADPAQVQLLPGGRGGGKKEECPGKTGLDPSKAAPSRARALADSIYRLNTKSISLLH